MSERSLRRGKLTPQEIETIERLVGHGRATTEIAATIARYPSTVSDYIRRHHLRPPGVKQQAPRPVRYEVTITDIPPAVYRLATDCAARRQISIGEAMLRFSQYVLKCGSPSKALDVVSWGPTK
jgi:hypothetical protein